MIPSLFPILPPFLFLPVSPFSSLLLSFLPFSSHLPDTSWFLFSLNPAKESGGALQAPPRGLGWSPSHQQFLNILSVKQHVLKLAPAITEAKQKAGHQPEQWTTRFMHCRGKGSDTCAKTCAEYFIYKTIFPLWTYLGAPRARCHWVILCSKYCLQVMLKSVNSAISAISAHSPLLRSSASYAAVLDPLPAMHMTAAHNGCRQAACFDLRCVKLLAATGRWLTP